MAGELDLSYQSQSQTQTSSISDPFIRVSDSFKISYMAPPLTRASSIPVVATVLVGFTAWAGVDADAGVEVDVGVSTRSEEQQGISVRRSIRRSGSSGTTLLTFDHAYILRKTSSN